MSDLIGISIAVGIIWVLAYNWLALLRNRNEERYLRAFPFPPTLLSELKGVYPNLNRKSFDLACHALRQFLAVHRASGFRPMGLPSRVVSDLWKAFSMDSSTYSTFCQKAFGRPVIPRLVSPYPEKDSIEEEELGRTWRYCCEQEGIYRNQPSRLPLLFAIDTKLGIPGAIEYQLQRPPEPDVDNGNSGGSDSSGPYYVSDFSHGDSTGPNDSGSFGDFGGGDSGGGDSGGGGGD